MADLKDIVGKNREFTGVKGIKTSSGATTANRVAEKGRLRFNDTSDLLEFYTGVEWKIIDTTPVVTSLQIDGRTDASSLGTSVAIDTTQSGNATIIITGDFFDTGASVSFVPSSGSNVNVLTTTVNSATSITVTVPRSSFLFANEPYQAKVQNSSGLFATGASLTVDTPLVFNNAADHIAQIFDSARGSVNITDFQATDPENDTITYSITAGSLPTGLTLNANGSITGATSAVGTNTDSTFTITAVSSSAATSTTTTVSRQFIIRQMAPATTQYTSGSGNFTVPSGLSAVDVLVVGNGGNAGGNHSGGGGGGGLIFRPGLPVTAGNNIPYNFGPMIGRNPDTPGTRNGDVVFGPLTAIAGGHGRNGSGGPPTSNTAAQAGGSGAGGTHSPSGTTGGNPAIQPIQSGDSGTYGFGHPGGNGNHSPGNHAAGGGGGGAGAAGQNAPNAGQAGSGGAGKAYTISGSSVHYAGGGAGGNHNGGTPGSGGTGGGGGNGGDGTNGLGGGAGSNNEPSTPGFIGGTGVIWVGY